MYHEQLKTPGNSLQLLASWKLYTSPDVLPRSVIWSSCHSCRWFSPWNRCPPYWQRPVWRSRRRSGTRRRFCPHCCCQWWGSWTYSQSFGPKTPSVRRSLLLRPSVDRRRRKTKLKSNDFCDSCVWPSQLLHRLCKWCKHLSLAM